MTGFMKFETSYHAQYGHFPRGSSGAGLRGGEECAIAALLDSITRTFKAPRDWAIDTPFWESSGCSIYYIAFIVSGRILFRALSVSYPWWRYHVLA